MSDLVNRLRELADAVTCGRDAVASEFTMSIPARPERDADLVLSAAADEIERLRATLERQQLSYEREREIDQEEIERLLAQRRGDPKTGRRWRATPSGWRSALNVPEPANEVLDSADGEALRQTHEWPGHWTRVAPRVEDHPQGSELAWIARGYPFTRPVLARSNVGVKRAPTWVAMEPKHEQFVRVELMADGFHGQDASAYGWFRDLEWLGPLVLPSA